MAKTRSRKLAVTRRKPVPRSKNGPRRHSGKYPRVPALSEFLKAYGSGEEGRLGRAEFAKRLDTTPAYLVHLCLGNRRASMALAIKVERHSHGVVKVEDMLPGEDWAYLSARKRVSAQPQA